jgi:hypothetical protein
MLMENQMANRTAAPRDRSPTFEEENHRMEGALVRGREIEFFLDGRPVPAFEGETVGAALLGMGIRRLRTTSRCGEPRGLYCGIGVCFDCVMTIDGRPNVRTCQTVVRAGMRVDSQSGNGIWRVEP